MQWTDFLCAVSFSPLVNPDTALAKRHGIDFNMETDVDEVDRHTEIVQQHFREKNEHT